MMADNIEHVISYWMMFQKFHSPALGGFAVVSHWLPFLLFSVRWARWRPPRPAPADPVRHAALHHRLARLGLVLFTDSLQMWQAMLLLVIHGCAGVLWQTSSQLLLHDIVARADLPSAVRLNATARYLGVFVGPAVGGVMMLALDPAHGILLNTLYYLPLLLWLWKAPYGPRFRKQGGAGRAAARARPGRHCADAARRGRPSGAGADDAAAGAASFFVGNSYQAQMPGFAHDLGHGDPACRTACCSPPSRRRSSPASCSKARAGCAPPAHRPRPGIFWCATLVGFAATHLRRRHRPAAGRRLLRALVQRMAQALVQLNAPEAIRGRVIGLFNMAALGMRAFSGSRWA